jgi:hypothetical protein
MSSCARRAAELLYGDGASSSTVAPTYFLGAVTLRLRGVRSDTPRLLLKKGVKPPFSTEDEDCSVRVILTLPICGEELTP